jgi:hypothetical protein
MIGILSRDTWNLDNAGNEMLYKSFYINDIQYINNMWREPVKKHIIDFVVINILSMEVG